MNDGDIIDPRAAAERIRRLEQKREEQVSEVGYLADSFAVALIQRDGLVVWVGDGEGLAESCYELAESYVEARRRLEAAHLAALEAADEQEVEGFDGDIHAEAVEVTPPGVAPLADA